MTCTECGKEIAQYPCPCGYRATRSSESQDDRLRMQSGNRLPRCTWITIDRCALPVAGSMLGQPPLCSWHRAWFEQVGTATSLEERIERPTFETWWDDREATYKQSRLWSLSKEEYWRYAHGQRIHDPKPETLPSVQEAPCYLSKEEFGLDLFEAIKTQAALRQAERQAAHYADAGHAAAAAEAAQRVTVLQHTLLTLFRKRTITDADLRRIQQIH